MKVVEHPRGTCIRIVTRVEQEYVVQLDDCGVWQDASLPVLEIETAQEIMNAYLLDGSRAPAEPSRFCTLCGERLEQSWLGLNRPHACNR